jgi:hypothetical protein
MSSIPITKELIEELEDFRRLYKNVWSSIIGQVLLARHIPSTSSRVSEEVKEKKKHTINELAYIFYKHWKDPVERIYGKKISFYNNLLNVLLDIIGDEAELFKNRAVEQWFNGSITTQQFAEYIVQDLHNLLQGLEGERVVVKPLTNLKDLFPG